MNLKLKLQGLGPACMLKTDLEVFDYNCLVVLHADRCESGSQDKLWGYRSKGR
jgi:hypothetical protein